MKEIAGGFRPGARSCEAGVKSSHDPSPLARLGGTNSRARFDFGDQAQFADKGFAGSSHSHEKWSHAQREAEKNARQVDETQSGEILVLALVQGICTTNDCLTPAPDSVPKASDWTTQIIQRVEHALQTSLRMGSDGKTQIDLMLDDLQVDGLKSLQISLSRTDLEVTFTRSTSTFGPELVAAADSLARQLAARFPSRIVRISSIDSESDAARSHDGPGGGITKLSALFVRRSSPT